MREIIFYKTRGGKQPVAEFLDSLNSKQAKKVTWVLNLIETMDQVPKEYYKKLTDTAMRFGKFELNSLRTSSESWVFTMRTSWC